MLEEKRIKRNKLYASLIDGLFIVVLISLFIIPSTINYVGALNEGTLTTRITTMYALSFVFALIVCFLYLYVPSLALKGCTLGMRLFSIQYVDSENNPLKCSKMCGRAIMVSLLSFVTVGLGALICALAIGTSHDGKTFYDVMISDKVVSTLE
ncbi:MAG: RDD family protein [Coprobacillus sp.]|nr:RDD family protein [Coprobacillus sp.]